MLFSVGMKEPSWVSIVGLLLVIGGEVLRKLAMLTASSNFNHYVRHVREEGHTLITHGVYAFCRHPSYVGWFYWSIGSQVRKQAGLTYSTNTTCITCKSKSSSYKC